MQLRDLIRDKASVGEDALRQVYLRYGFRNPAQAHRDVLEILESPIARRRGVDFLERMLEASGSAADPDLALRNFARFLSARADTDGGLSAFFRSPERRARLAWLLGGSPYLAGILIRTPEYLEILRRQGDGGKTRADYLEGARLAVAAGEGQTGRLASLHEFQQRELLRIGYRDLARQASVGEVTRELSWLADAIIQGALEDVLRDSSAEIGHPDFGFAVIGLGKLGGEELNFSSDIDIFYIYSDEAYADAATKLARRLNRHLTEAVSGAFYRVDLRLRPGGGRGPAASSMQSLATYYDSWGETFERLALSRARCVAGDPSLGDAFLELADRFVYKRYLDYAAIDEVRDIKKRIDKQARSSGEFDRNVKLGWGGIREIEFFVQVLQVLYGGEIPAIRARSTLRALEQLEQAGLIEAAVAGSLREAYVFLRDVEHKLQIVDQRQTHTLPDEPGEFERCARRLRLSPDELGKRLVFHRNAVAEVFGELFSEAPQAEEKPSNAVHRFVSGAMTRDASLAWLEHAGFRDPRQAEEMLRSLRDAPAFGHSPSRMRNLLANLLGPLLEQVMSLEEPERALARFERVTSAIGAREAFFTSLLENPQAIRRLVRILGLSEALSETLIARPGAIEFLVDEARLSRPLRPPFDTDSRRMFELYAGVQHLCGFLERKRASRMMSLFAELEIRRIVGPGAPIAVFALGKFGERELNYRSDLDILAFYRDDFDTAAALVETLVRELDGEYKLDLRLRPEGRQGALVWNLENTGRYLRTRGETWERMAWTKARFIAGDRELAGQLGLLIDDFVYGSGFGRAEIDEMKHIRQRMEKELGKEGGAARDLKLGKGGLVDLEFLAEFLQIANGIRIPNTALVLRRAGVDRQLVADYLFLREVESMLRLSSTLSTSRIEEKDIHVLEAMLGVSGFETLYREVTERVRSAFEAY